MTIGNLFCGYACVVYATRGEYETAAPFVGIAIVLDMLDGVLRKLYDDMISDRYNFPTGKDFSYMQHLNRWGKDVPFKQMLVVINDTHKNGLARG